MFCEVLELFALVVETVFGNRIIHMLFNFSRISYPLDNISSRDLRELIKLFFNVWLCRPWKTQEFLRIKNKLELGHFFEEAFKVKSPLVDKFDVSVADGFLLREWWNWDSQPPLLKFFVKLVEFAESAITFPWALRVLTFAVVDDMTSLVLRIDNLKLRLVGIIHNVIILCENIVIHSLDLLFFVCWLNFSPSTLFYLLLAFHIFNN